MQTLRKEVVQLRTAMKQCVHVLRWFWGDYRPCIPSVLLLLMLDVFASLQGVLMAVLSKELIDAAIDGDLPRVRIRLLMFGGLAVFGLLSMTIGRIRAATLQVKFSSRLRGRLFQRLMHADWRRAAAIHSGDWVTRLTEDIADLTDVLMGTIPSLIALCVQLVASFVVLFHYEPWLALFAFALAPVTLLLSRIWGRRLKVLHQQTQKADSLLHAFLQEGIQHLALFKVFRFEQRAAEQLDALHLDRIRLAREREGTSAAANVVLSLGYWIGYIIAFSWGAVRLAGKATTFGTITAFLQLVQQVQGPFMGLARSLPGLIRGYAAAERLMEISALPLERTQGIEGTVSAEGAAVSSDGAASVSLVAKDISFSYDGKRTVIENINLTVPPGIMVAVSGESGSGKTTFIRILAGLLRADEGTLSWSVHDAKDMQARSFTGGDPTIREYITLVPQGNSLMSGSVRDNLRMGNPNADDADVKEALRLACADEFCSQLPQGLDTLLGEGGFGLSEGQAQRIGLARAFLRNSGFLILDEVTSALDLQTEHAILSNLRAWCSHRSVLRSVLFISHRSAVLDGCDAVLEMNAGQLSKQETLAG